MKDLKKANEYLDEAERFVSTGLRLYALIVEMTGKSAEEIRAARDEVSRRNHEDLDASLKKLRELGVVPEGVILAD
jgi:hypothetical protein